MPLLFYKFGLWACKFYINLTCHIVCHALHSTEIMRLVHCYQIYVFMYINIKTRFELDWTQSIKCQIVKSYSFIINVWGFILSPISIFNPIPSFKTFSLLFIKVATSACLKLIKISTFMTIHNHILSYLQTAQHPLWALNLRC